MIDSKKAEWKVIREGFTKGVFGKPLNGNKMTESKMLIFKVTPGGVFPPHIDPYHHMFYYLEGQGVGSFDKEEYEIKPGIAVEIPSGVEHGYKNTGEGNMLLITLKIPVE